MSKRFGAIIVLSSLALAPASAAEKSGKACLQQCRAELKSNGTWTTLPRGYCRQKCNYYGGGK
jgi:hypothetical protein